MKQQKKKIITLTISLFIVGYSDYLIWNYLKTKDKQENIQHQVVQRNSLNIENSAKKKENDDDQQLVSYFSVFVVFWIIIILAYIIIHPGWIVSINEKTHDPYLYLMFIKMVCEMVCYENCMVHKNKEKVGNSQYQPTLQWSIIDLKCFLDTFLFGSQTGKNKIRQQAHQIIFHFRNRFLIIYLALFFFFLFGYLFVIIINLIINIFFHGFNKTRSKLKINHLWTFIQRMNKLYKKIIAYILLSVPLVFFILICSEHLQKLKNLFFAVQFRDSCIGDFWLLNDFFNTYQEDIKTLFLNTKYKNYNFLEKIKLTNDKGEIIHHNLYSKHLEDFNQNIFYLIKCGNSLREKGKELLQDMKNYFNKNAVFEQRVFQNLKNFIGDNNRKIGDL